MLYLPWSANRAVLFLNNLTELLLMKQTISLASLAPISLCLMLLFLLPSCTTTDEFLKAIKIDTGSTSKESAEQKTIADLKKQLARAKKNETELSAEIAELRNKIEQQEADHITELTDLETLLEDKEASYNLQIGSLKDKLDETEALISIQGKVIGLLDDSDQTLQKSIAEQLKDR